MRIAAALVLACLAGAVQAHDETPCTAEPESTWQPMSAALKKAEDLGHTVKVAEVHHKCYELRGKTKTGQRFEMVLNPLTLEPREAKKK